MTEYKKHKTMSYENTAAPLFCPSWDYYRVYKGESVKVPNF